jgi:hypothetical protein
VGGRWGALRSAALLLDLEGRKEFWENKFGDIAFPSLPNFFSFCSQEDVASPRPPPPESGDVSLQPRATPPPIRSITREFCGASCNATESESDFNYFLEMISYREREGPRCNFNFTRGFPKGLRRISCHIYTINCDTLAWVRMRTVTASQARCDSKLIKTKFFYLIKRGGYFYFQSLFDESNREL